MTTAVTTLGEEGINEKGSFSASNQQTPLTSPCAFYLPSALAKGEFDLDGGCEDAINFDFEIPFITALRLDRLSKMADWTGENGERKTLEIEDDGQWSFATFFETSRSQVGGALPAGGRRNSRSIPTSNTRLPPSSRKTGFTTSSRRVIREASVTVEPSWTLLDEVEFIRLAKLSFAPEDCQVIEATGSLPIYDPMFDRVLARQERPLGILEQTPVKSLSVSGDPVLTNLVAAQSAKFILVTSDVVLSALICSSRSLIPWDITVTRDSKNPNVLFIDKRDLSDLDLVQVNECKPEAPPVDEKDSINSSSNLAVEATRINANLPHLLSNRSEAPFCRSSASESFNYVQWDMGDDMVLLVRCQVNCAFPSGKKTALLKALLEYDWGRGSMDWRQRLDVQRAAALASELKNNNAQIARWVCSAVLANVDLLKIAFVSRINPRDRTRHAILGVMDVDPHEFSQQMGVDLANGFGIVKTLSRRFLDMDPLSSSFVIMRDPQKPLLRIYQVPSAQ